MSLLEAIAKAREVTGDNGIGVRVAAGKFQAVRVIRAKRGRTEVSPLCPWGSRDEVCLFLRAIPAEDIRAD